LIFVKEPKDNKFKNPSEKLIGKSETNMGTSRNNMPDLYIVIS